MNREDAVRKLQQWNDSGAIELRPSGVVARFRIVQKFPQTEETKNYLISDIYAQILSREKEDMARVDAVIDLITSNKCLSRELAGHFGDDSTVPKNGCGHCQTCLKRGKIHYYGTRDCKGRVDAKRTKAILFACPIRDDARFLARIAFGISSPRVTREKMGKHPVFASMDDCDFEVCAVMPSLDFALILAIFSMICRNWWRLSQKLVTVECPSRKRYKSSSWILGVARSSYRQYTRRTLRLI